MFAFGVSWIQVRAKYSSVLVEGKQFKRSVEQNTLKHTYKFVYCNCSTATVNFDDQNKKKIGLVTLEQTWKHHNRGNGFFWHLKDFVSQWAYGYGKKLMNELFIFSSGVKKAGNWTKGSNFSDSVVGCLI